MPNDCRRVPPAMAVHSWSRNARTLRRP